MKAKLGLLVQHKTSKKVYEITRIHPYAKEIELTKTNYTEWDFESIETDFVDTIDDYQIIKPDNSFSDITGFQVTTEDYIVIIS